MRCKFSDLAKARQASEGAAIKPANGATEAFNLSVSASLTQVLRWTYWRTFTAASPDDVTNKKLMLELNTDSSTKGLSAPEIRAIVAACPTGAISRDTMTDLFHRGEVLPEGGSMEGKTQLIGSGRVNPITGREAGNTKR